MWKQFGGNPERLDAKTADAIVLLDWACKKEITNGEVE
jgi:hypothetical protein